MGESAEKTDRYLERNRQLPGFPSPDSLRRIFRDNSSVIPKSDLAVMVSAPKEALQLINAGRGKNERTMDGKELLSLIVNNENCDLELFEQILNDHFNLIPKAIIDGVIMRVKEPRRFCTASGIKHRTKLVEDLIRLIKTYKPDCGPSLGDILGFDIPVFFNKNKRLTKLSSDLETLRRFLQTKKNPLYEEDRDFDELVNSPFFDLKFCMNYGWVSPGELIGKYATYGSVKSLWKSKTTGKDLHTAENKKRLVGIGNEAVKFSQDRNKLEKEPKKIADLKRIIFEEMEKMDKQVHGPNDLKDLELGSLTNYVGTDFFLAIMTKELFGTSEKQIGIGGGKSVAKKLTPKARIELINMILKDPDIQITLIPAMNDNRVSFGAYQTVEKTFDDVVGTTPIKVPPFEQCMTFTDQTKVVVWLTYKNLCGIEQALFRECGNSKVLKNRRSIFKSATREELESFYCHLTAVAHNKGRGFVRVAINSFKNDTFSRHGKSTAFQVFRNNLYAKLGDDGNKYGNDVKEISKSLTKGHQLYAKR